MSSPDASLMSIGDLVDRGEANIQTGPFGTQLKASDYVEAGIPIINVRNIGYGGLRQAQLEFLAEAKAEKLSAHKLLAGDIVFGRKGAVDRHTLIGPDQSGWIQGSDCIRLRINSKCVDKSFLSYYFRTPSHQHWMEAQGSFGATMASLNHGIIRRIAFPTFSIEQQRKIAAVLTAYDDMIENNRQRIALLEQMAEEIYREWFVRLRFPGHEHTPVHKGVPEGWETGKLADIADMVFGQSPPSEYYNTVGDGLPFHQGVGSYGLRFPNHETYCSVGGRNAQAGSILFSVRAPVGRLNIADQEVILGRGLAGLNEKQDRNSYLYQLLKSQFSREDLIGNGAIFASVSKKELQSFPVFAPRAELVNHYQEIAEPIDRQIEAIQRSSLLLSQTRDLLLNRLISGKLRVDDLDIRFPPSMLDWGER